MPEMNCGCKIISGDIVFSKTIRLDNGMYHSDRLLHQHNQYVNVCGNCSNKEKLFNNIEKTKLNLTKEQFKILTEENVEDKENEEDDEETYFYLKELKEHMKDLTPEKRQELKKFEQVRNLANGRDKNEGMNEIDKAKSELEEEEKECNPDIVEYDSDDSQTQRAKRILRIQKKEEKKKQTEPKT